MSENKMSEVAKLLGVELDEEFTIKNRPTSYIYMLTDQGLCSRLTTQTLWNRSLLIEDFITGGYQIQKLSKPILDAAEKKYISRVIKPFRNRVIEIIKHERDQGYQFLTITVRGYDGNTVIFFPNFKTGAMYRGMQIGRRYTVMELGL